MRLTFAQINRNRILWLAGAVLLVAGIAIAGVQHSATATSRLGSLTIVTQAYAFDSGNEISQPAAEADALKAAAELRPDVAGLAVAAARPATSVREVNDSTGHAIYANSSGVNAWVLEVTAPAQQGYKKVSGAVVLNAADGSVIAMSILMTNK